MSNNDYDQLVRSVYVDNFQQVNEILENQKKDYTEKTFQIQYLFIFHFLTPDKIFMRKYETSQYIIGLIFQRKA